MAWIEKRTTGWLVRYREDGRAYSEMFSDHGAAKERRAEVDLEQSRGTYIRRNLRQQPLADYARELLDSSPELEESTLYHYRHQLQKWITPEFGLEAIGDIDGRRMRLAFASMTSKGATPSLLQKIKMLLSKVFRQALAEEVISRNPMLGVKVPKAQRREIVILEPEQVELLADAIRPKYRATVLLSAWGTLRIGEIGALKREDLDFERGVVHVRRALSTAGAKTIVKEPKTAASRRTVALPPWVMKEMAAHALRHADAEGWLFRTGRGSGWLTHNTMYPIWTEACEGAEITDPRPRFHDLRHTAVAIMIRTGAHPKVIQARCGHATMAMTMDCYGHLFPGSDTELAMQLEVYKPKEATWTA